MDSGKLLLARVQNGLNGGFLQSTKHWELRPAANDDFVADDEGITFSFARGAQREVTGFVLSVSRSSGISFQRK